MGYLNNLIGKLITDILFTQGTYHALNEKNKKPQIVDEIVIYFEDYSLSISNHINLDNSTSDVNSLIGKKIKSISESDEEAKLITMDGKWISIDLRSEAFVGPEAMCLNGPNNFIVVWN
jgi:hypothetical protein